jgi:multiple sugar transport system substrate-binding protein
MAPRIRFRGLASAAAVATLAASVAACGGGSDQQTGGPVTLRYGLWDSNQEPVYQKCANAFQQQNPNIKIKIELNNWNDYWGGLARGFIG